MSIVEYNSTERLAQLEIDRVLASLGRKPTEAELAGIVSTVMSQAETGALPLPRFETDTFLSSEQLKELADRITINTTVFLEECEKLMATAQVVGSIVAGMEESVQTACGNASDAVRTLLAYHASLSNSGQSISVIAPHLTGSFSTIGDVITSGFTNGKIVTSRVKNIDSNGVKGNFLELSSDVRAGLPLAADGISFVDPVGIRSDERAIVDDDEYSLFEIESYLVDPFYSVAVVDENVMPNSLTKIQEAVRSEGQAVRMVDVEWCCGPSGGSMYADITLEVERGALSVLAIKVANRTDENGISIPYPTIERVDVSSDQTSWTEVDVVVDAITSSAGGEIRILTNAPSCKYVKIRLRQSVGYSTVVANVCHWLEQQDGTGSWISGEREPVFKIGLHSKSDWFLPHLLIDTNGDHIKRKVFSISAKRFAIAIKEMRAEVYDYMPETTIESKEYILDRPIDRVTIRASESVPSGTSISYEISHDNGGTWTQIMPIERSGQGAEVIVFSAGGTGNPNILGSTYINVTEQPTSIRIRAKLSASGSVAPSINSLSIEPIFKE